MRARPTVQKASIAAVLALALSGPAVVLGAGGASADETQGGRPLTATLSGANEIGAAGPGAGDPDGTGTARVTFNPGKNLVCWDISVTGVSQATRGHIHAGAAGANGPIVVDFFNDGNTQLTGCTTPNAGTTARDILADPAGYYVNVHNAEFPAGAVRGQLGK